MKQSESPRYSLLSASPWTVVLSIALATADNFAEPDLWIHMLTGQTTLRTGHIPRFDTYSYAAANMPWHNHEWLSQVALAFCYAHLGIFGLKLLKLVVTTILIGALAIGISATRASGQVQRLTLILSAVAISTQMQFRPQLFTFMMMAVVMASLAIEVYRGRAVLWPLIPMFALWANFHGGYIVGLGAMAVAVAVFFFQGFLLGDTARKTSAIRLGLVTVGCALATIINPFGVGLWTGVFHSVNDPLIRQIVADWVPLPKLMLSMLHSDPSQLLSDAAPLLMFAAFVLFVARAPDLEDTALLAVATMFIGAALWAARNVAIGVIAVTIPLARHASLAFQRGAKSGTGAQPAASDGPPRWMLAICALAVVLVGGTFSNRLKTWKPVPVGALTFMQQHNLHGNMLCQFEWGSWVLWHLGDSFKVYIDPRGELVYSDKQERDYAIFFYGQSSELLDAYPHDFVLMGTATKGADLVRKDPRWHVLYTDQTGTLFGRAAISGEAPVTGDAAGIDGKPKDTYFP